LDNTVAVRSLSLWAIPQSNAIAFIKRVNTAVASAGIASDVENAKLAVIRFGPPPSGKKCSETVDDFLKRGGTLVCPSDGEIATLHAMKTIKEECPKTWEAYARAKRPSETLDFLKSELSWFLGKTETEAGR
jgi:hypothetical protein